VLDGDPAPPPKRAQPLPLFSAHVYCDQTAEWMKMPLGTEVGLVPGHIVLDDDHISISWQLRHVSTIRRKLVRQQYVLHMSSQYGELRPTSG